MKSSHRRHLRDLLEHSRSDWLALETHEAGYDSRGCQLVLISRSVEMPCSILNILLGWNRNYGRIHVAGTTVHVGPCTVTFAG
jgi:hypothetical protein